MSTESTTTDVPEAAPAAQPATAPRDRGLLIAGLVALLVAALAVGGLFLYRNMIDERNSDTEAAFTKTVTDQGATVDTVECEGDTCAAIIGGSAYTVLVQEDDKGKQHFGVVAFTG